MLVDLSLKELRDYKPPFTKQKDFSKFWENTLAVSASEPLNTQVTKVDYLIKGIEAFKVYYDGFGGARICGHFLLPKSGNAPYPVILFFHGYGGKKDDINYYLQWVLLGYAVMAIDIRGQSGESIDNKVYPAPSTWGYMTKGAFSKEDYYYRGVYIDCVRAVDFLASREEIDINRLCVTGGSQGGGLTLAAAALDSRPSLAIAEVPYLCHFRRAVEWAEEVKNVTYLEFAMLIKNYPEREEELFDNLSYFDNLNLCTWIKARTVITCAMKDIVCPPSTIFAVFNNMEVKKHMEIMPFYEHNYETTIGFGEKGLEYIKKYL